MAALNSNMMLDFKQEVVDWLKMLICSEKSPQLTKKHQAVKISTTYRKPELLNPFPVTDLRSEVELVH